MRGVKGNELSYFSNEYAVKLPASIDSVILGFCNHQTATSSDIVMNGKGWTECALRLPASALSTYANNNIVAVNAALVARINVDTLTVWVQKNYDGPNLASATVVKRGTEGVVKGWNNIKLDSPYAIGEGTEDLFIGYSLHQRANVDAVSMVEPAMANTSYLKQGSADWKNMSDKGVLSIEAIAAGGSVPSYDLGVNSVTISPNPSAGATALQIEAVVHNYGAKALKGFTLSAGAQGMTTITNHFDEEIASTASLTVKFNIVPDKETDESALWTVLWNHRITQSMNEAGTTRPMLLTHSCITCCWKSLPQRDVKTAHV